jgi:hypothetical protein
MRRVACRRGARGWPCGRGGRGPHHRPSALQRCRDTPGGACGRAPGSGDTSPTGKARRCLSGLRQVQVRAASPSGSFRALT